MHQEARFDYDNLTLAEALPWFWAPVRILVGCFTAGVLSLVGMTLNEEQKAIQELDYQI